MAQEQLDTYLNLCTQVYDLSKPVPPEDAYALYRGYVKEAKGPILEPMCGTGRFLLPLIEEGFDVHGFDASQSMLDALQDKAKAKHLRPNVWFGFMEDLSRSEKYGVVFIPSGSFGLLIDLEAAKNTLKIIYSHLNPGGLFVFEAETLASGGHNVGLWRGNRFQNPGNSFILSSFLNLPVENQVETTLCRYELVQKNQIIQTEIEELKVRLYEPNQLTPMLKEVGFKEIRLIKAFDRTKSPEKNAEVIVYECRK